MMGHVYHKTVTKAMPPGAELFTRQGERFARWKTSKGKTRTAPVTTGTDGSDRIVIETRTYYAKYRDGQGIVRQDVPTGCHDEDAAKAVLADMVGRAQLVKAKVMTAAQDAIANHSDTPIGEHFEAYLTYLQAVGNCPRHIANVKRQFESVTAGCGFGRLADLKGDKLTQWLVNRKAKGMGARTRNTYRGVMVAFANWCMSPDSSRLLSNPFAGVPMADTKADCRRKRRALTEAELIQLLSVAQDRPLAEYGRKSEPKDPKTRKGKRDTWKLTPLTFETMGEAVERARDKLKDSPDFISELEVTGRERALVYKTLVLTGLRKGELASVTVGQVQLEGDMPHIQLNAADEKSGEGNAVPLRADLAADLSQWLADKLETLYGPSKRFVGPFREALPPDMPLFNVPDGLDKILNRDLAAAGIPKKDGRGWVADVHAMRKTFGTLLSKGGVSLRTAQEAMRHSDPKLTANVYTDAKLLDVAGALETLPRLPLTVPSESETTAMKATGTTDQAPFLNGGNGNEKFAPEFAPTTGDSVQTMSFVGKMGRVATTRTDSVERMKNRGIPWENRDFSGQSPCDTHRAREGSNLQPSDSKSATLSN